MNKKALVISTVALTLTATSLVGCSDSKTGEAQTSSTPLTSASARAMSLSMSFYDRGTIAPDLGTAENNIWTKFIQEKTGINLKISPVPRAESVNKLNTLVASGSAPDVILEYDVGFRNQLYLQKQIMPIGDLIEKNSTTYKQLLNKFPLLKKLSTRDDGKIYDLGRILGYVPYSYTVIRQDWLDKMKLSVPKTAEELFQVAKAFATQDPDGNGKKDTYGLNMAGGGNLIDPMFQNVTWILKDGKWVKDWDRAETANAFRKKLFDEGIVDKDFLTDKNGKKAEQDFVTGKIGIYTAAGSYKVFTSQYETLRKNVPDAKLVAIALPSSQYGSFSPDFNPPVQLTGVLNAKTKDPEAAIKMIDYLSSPEWIKTTYSGIEGTHYKVENSKEVPINADKNKKELDWLGDFRMLGGQYVYNEFDTTMKGFDQSNPLQKEFYDLGKEVFSLNITKDRPLASITLGGFMPTLPADMQFISKNLLDSTSNPIGDLWNKAIVSGSSYTSAQAKQDAINLWKKSDGDKLEAWYQDWYTKNKDTMVSQNDLLSMNFN
ncbi:extracellular solute-binding protein [Paenibacillus aceris]|uniref:Aldouronate transport system substrate-binding protein n=1 Tax=Paenibacillus aceris TaxID=869555 RepID=A0ABS4I434_9BACL|nr:extracellular solute-binding protein [Paenibacillus aceris]MBP1965682.1 putative aldouronate transport system substrate-binding protein [Paenibacillus aceris]NHW36395.1 extracellular solute-binding protein [Paenibacillus aceris]